MDWKPDGYPEVSPYLLVRDGEATLRFLEAAFGARRLRVIPRADAAGLLHAEAQIGAGVVMLGEVEAPVPAHVHLYVPDAEAAHARALATGARSVQAPAAGGDGDLRGGVVDAGGTTWWISTQQG